jgi:uncharacterized membrane protein YeaQ/YmgE (transglycosylase-associated protein family)
VAVHQRGENIVMLETNSLIVILVIGLIAGWLAGKLMKGSGFGIIGDIIVGIIGAFIGAWLWSVLHLPTLGNFWINSDRHRPHGQWREWAWAGPRLLQL